MSEVVNLPKLGFDMREGTFLNWVKKVGETVNQGEVLAEIESDKATIEVESSASGVLLETLVKEGDVVPVGAPIARVGAAGEAGSAPPNGGKPDVNAASAPDQSVGKPQTPTQQVINATSNEKAESASPTGDNGARPQAAVAAPQPAQTAPPAPDMAEDENLPGGVKASPIARRIAEERGIDLHKVKGSGPNGRISKSDVESYQEPVSTPLQPAPAQLAVAPAPVQAVPRQAAPAPTGADVEEIPLTRLRQRIAQRMTESKQTVPHFYVTVEIDMEAALALRKQINESLDEAHKVSVNDMVVKAAALTLRDFPNLNTHFYGDKLIRYKHINIGIAVALDGGGLMNVVAKDADITAISRLAARNKEMIAGARAGKVKPDDVEGSTFTVSNLGAYDVLEFSAIINPPEAGIIAVSSAMQVPVVINGEIKIGTRMKATISVDHRVSDGAEGARFMQAFKRLLESPMRLLV